MNVLAQITDMHLDHPNAAALGIDTRNNFLRVLGDVRARGITDLVLTGDLAEKSAIPWMFRTLDGLGLSYRFIFGNHDDPADYDGKIGGTPDARQFSDEDFESYRAIFLDSHAEEIGREQLKWAVGRITETDRTAVVFMHHPALSCGATFMDANYPLKNRAEVEQALNAAKREVFVFCGHFHASDSRKAGFITQNIAPSVYHEVVLQSKKLEFDLTRFGYRIIEFGRTLNSEVVWLSHET